MKDLTVLYLTANLLPYEFAKYQREILLEAVEDYPIISISRKPISLGTNILDNGEKCMDNIYRQMLRGAERASTDFIAIAEDDTLYHKDHFNFYRPDKDTFAYDQNRFALFTWRPELYSWRDRKSNCSLIAPRQLMIDALTERFNKYPNKIPEMLVGELGKERIEKIMGVTIQKSIEVFANVSMIQFNHDFGSEDRAIRHRKSFGPIKAYDLYYWGRADELVKHYV